MNKIHSVLLVDDDPIANFLHEDLINNLHISDEIKVASNGAEALDLVRETCEKDKCPELILLDLNMPVMDGFQFLEAYQQFQKKKGCKVKIIVLSSSANPSDIEKAKELHVSDYLVKPLTEEKVKDCVQEYFKTKDV